MNGVPAQVEYHQGQRLTAALFRAEQAYHVTMRERHNLADHDWGIALGLGLSAGYVEAGYAIDGYGRELVLPARTQFELTTGFDELGGDSLDVSLVYSRGIEPPGDYAVERPVIQLDRALGQGADRRHPKVAPGDENFDATRTAPHDTLHPWPVYLGTITRNPADPAKPPVIVTGDRPYIGARAARVFTPSGDASVSLGRDVAVYAGTASSPVLRWAHGSPAQKRGLEVAGALLLGGDLRVDGGRVVLPHVRPASENKSPAWQLDHVTTTSAAGTPVEQLRLVLGPTAAGPATEFVIGRFENGQFTPCLTVADDGTVTVHGNLVVEGTAELKGGTIP